MLCQNCQKRIANVHFTKIINGKKVEMYLCEKCANEQGHLTMASPLNIANFLSGFVNYDNKDKGYVPSVKHVEYCKKCGMTFEDFQKYGKLGCSNCYKTYRDRLKPILKRLHGGVSHNGKVPGKVSESFKASEEIKKLKGILNQAVQNEEYEKAAEIRDKIKAIEADNN